MEPTLTITVHSYFPGAGADVTIDGERLSVPEARGNRHWEMLLAWIAEGNRWPAAPSIAVTVEQVAAERSRRLALGFDYDFGEDRGVHHIGTTAEDMAGWDEVTQLASALVRTGQGATAIPVVTNTGPCAIIAEEWDAVLIAAGVFRQPFWAASFALQAMDPIPADFADDVYWPS